MNLIAAADIRWGIGKKGGLLLRIPEDMAFFRSLTINKAVVMGRKTLDSLPGGKPLADRQNIVLTRDPLFKREGVTVCRSVGELIELIRNYPPDFVYAAGGGEIYKATLSYCQKAFITKINADFCADTFMPDLDALQSWKMKKCSEEYFYNGFGYRFAEYENISVNAFQDKP